MVTLRLLNNQHSPVNAKNPSDEAYRRKKLEESHKQLGLVHIFVPEASTDHCSRAWDDNVQSQANVSPDIL